MAYWNNNLSLTVLLNCFLDNVLTLQGSIWRIYELTACLTDKMGVKNITSNGSDLFLP